MKKRLFLTVADYDSYRRELLYSQIKVNRNKLVLKDEVLINTTRFVLIVIAVLEFILI